MTLIHSDNNKHWNIVSGSTFSTFNFAAPQPQAANPQQTISPFQVSFNFGVKRAFFKTQQIENTTEVTPVESFAPVTERIEHSNIID